MSSALARKKRIGDTLPNPSITSPSTNSNKNAGLTLPQVIAVIDSRLITLESFVKDSKMNPVVVSSSVSDNNSNEFLNEIQSRYEILAQEIAEVKDIVLKLQSYTMDVNKTLLEERIHILSDLGNNNAKEESFEFNEI
jgi:hypothetical protein